LIGPAGSRSGKLQSKRIGSAKVIRECGSYLYRHREPGICRSDSVAVAARASFLGPPGEAGSSAPLRRADRCGVSCRRRSGSSVSGCGESGSLRVNLNINGCSIVAPPAINNNSSEWFTEWSVTAERVTTTCPFSMFHHSCRLARAGATFNGNYGWYENFGLQVRIVDLVVTGLEGVDRSASEVSGKVRLRKPFYASFSVRRGRAFEERLGSVESHKTKTKRRASASIRSGRKSRLCR